MSSPDLVRARAGFTLVELLVVIVIIGVMAAYGVPRYLKSVENGKAQTAASTMIMIGTSNRMYALDHNNAYLNGTLNNACNAAACNTASASVCNLIACKYMATDEWDSKDYSFTGLSGGFIATAQRRSGLYSSWGYRMATDGTVTCVPYCGGADGPPTPNR